MKKLPFLLLILLLFSGCGLISSVKDVTDRAADVLGSVDELLREVDSRVESGELSQEIADLIDERIENLAEVLNQAIEQNGGFLFEQVNGTLDNIFFNISDLLDQIKQGILDESAPALISQLSTELQMQINLLSASLEDVVTLTFGNTFILVDKVTNSVITMGSLIFLVVGVLLFSILLFVRKRKVRGVGVIGVVLMLLYVAFFLAVLLIPYVRGLVVKGLNFGKEIEAIELQPVITGIVPQTFVMGKNERIILYGKHLGKINPDSVVFTLRQGNEVKKTIPKSHLIVVNDFKIVLGNFKSGSLNWQPIRFAEFNRQLKQRSPAISTAQLTNFAYRVNDLIFPRVVKTSLPGTRNIVLGNAPVITAAPSGRNLTTIRSITKRPDFKTFRTEIVSNSPAPLLNLSKEIFLQQYDLPEGDYGLHVANGSVEVGSPQFLSVLYPPPPAPKPDLYPVDLYFTGGQAIAGERASLTLKLGIAYPEEVPRPFRVRLTATPSIGTKTLTVSAGQIAAASASNLTTVTLENLLLNASGDYTFQVLVDDQNRIEESSESNNTFSKTLRVSRFAFDAEVKLESFISKEDLDWADQDEYRINFSISATGHPTWKFDFNKDGDAGKSYSISKSRTFQNLKEGDQIIVTTSGREADGGLRFDDDPMGSETKGFPISDEESQSHVINLNADKYDVKGRILITRKVVN